MLDLTTEKNRRIAVTSHPEGTLLAVSDTGNGETIYSLLNPEQALAAATALTERNTP